MLSGSGKRPKQTTYPPEGQATELPAPRVEQPVPSSRRGAFGGVSPSPVCRGRIPTGSGDSGPPAIDLSASGASHPSRATGYAKLKSLSQRRQILGDVGQRDVLLLSLFGDAVNLFKRSNSPDYLQHSIGVER